MTTTMKQKYVEAYMKTARIFGDLSTAKRKQVGAIIVKDNRIISIGYNGMPSGWTNECEDMITLPQMQLAPGIADLALRYELRTKPEVLHAESNAIAKLARSTESGEGASIFVTCAPCLECAKMIYQSGIREVFYDESYRSTAGIDFLHKCKIDVFHVDSYKGK